MAKVRAAALIAAVSKIKDYARQNPDKAEGAIGKVEGFVRTRAGAQHAAKVDKGGDAVRKGLGLPPHRAGGAPGTGQVPPPPPPSSGPTH